MQPRYVAGVDNVLADAVSTNKLEVFSDLYHRQTHNHSSIPGDLWKVWWCRSLTTGDWTNYVESMSKPLHKCHWLKYTPVVAMQL